MKRSIIDPANENVEYKADIDISDLIQLEEVISTLKYLKMEIGLIKKLC